MPELPEVERQRRLLRPVMEGVRIERVLVRRPDLRVAFAPDFARRLEGRTVRTLGRRAKYLVAELSSGDVLLMHLGMSGWFTVVRRHAGAYGTHDHVIFHMATGVAVVFNDPRRFGSMRVVDRRIVAADPALAALGPEPLSPAFDAAALGTALARKKTTLKAALSDQRVVAGLGNIYVCEALHRARLSPRRRASTLATPGGAPRPQAAALVRAIKDVLTDAFASRGGDRFRVYDRESRRCPRRGCPGVIRRIVQGGRSTYFCPHCQRR